MDKLNIVDEELLQLKLSLKQEPTLENAINILENVLDRLLMQRETNRVLTQAFNSLQDKENNRITIKREKTPEIDKNLDAFHKYLSDLEMMENRKIKMPLIQLGKRYGLNKNQRHYLIPYLQKDLRFVVSLNSRRQRFIALNHSDV